MKTSLTTPYILKSSRMKYIFMSLICAVFVFAAWLMIKDGELVKGLFCGGFFGLCFLVLFTQVIKPGTLTLTQEGFEQSVLWRKSFYAWPDVSNFGTYSLRQGFFKTNTFVRFDWTGAPVNRLSNLSRNISGGDAQLSDCFGLRPEALAQLLEAYRQQVLLKNMHE